MDNDSREKMPSLDETRWLIAHADRELSLDLPADPLQLASRLQRQHGAARGRMLCELFELRLRAEKKFTLANRMFFTRRSLEQATDEMIARYKAARYRDFTNLVDLCSGMGGDALALGQGLRDSATITLVERVPQICALALANLNVYGVADEAVKSACCDVRQVPLADFQAWHLDPDRRPHSRRRSSPEFSEPPLSEFLRIDHLPSCGAIKLSPAADVDGLFSKEVELEWIGHHRECQQLVAWFGALARFPGKRAATVLYESQNSIQAATIVSESLPPAKACGAVQQYVYEPSAPLLAAGLEHVLAGQHELRRLSSSAYFTSDVRVESQHLSGFEVIDCLPFRKKPIKQRLTELDLRVTEVKKRGVALEPAVLLRELASEGQQPVAILLYPSQRSVRAIIARRLGDT